MKGLHQNKITITITILQINKDNYKKLRISMCNMETRQLGLSGKRDNYVQH